jgi:hypothetical protein
MKDSYHSFSLGLVTVLECLRLAEQQGHVPELPPEWWTMISNRYEQLRRPAAQVVHRSDPRSG